MTRERWWGACGVENCTDCFPFFDENNNELSKKEIVDITIRQEQAGKETR